MEVAAIQEENSIDTNDGGATEKNEIPEKFEAQLPVVNVLVNEEIKETSSSLENSEPKKVEKPNEIRLEIPLTNRYNNIVYYPDLLKEAGISIVKTPPRYISGSESPVSDSPHSEWSDFETPDDFQPTSPTTTNQPALFNDDSNGFFQKLLENAEKYNTDEQEKNRKKRKTRNIKKEQQYDVNDPFIDDSELVPLQRDFGK
ncbi:16045_t:CDS:2, partial [Acaulospora morrowiae]